MSWVKDVVCWRYEVVMGDDFNGVVVLMKLGWVEISTFTQVEVGSNTRHKAGPSDVDG